MRADPTEWGCRCGRLCLADEDDCESCDAPRRTGIELKTILARNRFLKKAERGDRRVLEGAGAKLASVENSYRDAAGEFDKHCRGMQGSLTPWLVDQGYPADPLDVLYGSDEFDVPWCWG